MTNDIAFPLRSRGCLLGGAVGDALGAPVEFKSHSQIVAHFGAGGIRDFAPAYGRAGAITDDTQMTLFTAEGLLRANTRYAARGICHTPTVLHHGESPNLEPQIDLNWHVATDGWLIDVPALWSRRAPGNTCLSALRNAKHIGEPASNDSKGCGAVMRAAPVGLVMSREEAFELGTEFARLTHGHPSGYLSAGFLALTIAEITAGTPLRDSIRAAKLCLLNYPDHEEVLDALGKAEALVSSAGTNPIAAGALGQGWIAEEALAIALYCALAEPNFEQAVILAVNHSGDSDSTGSIAGNICGALYGGESIPARWLNSLELRDEITAIADDLTALREGKLDDITDSIWTRYPGW